jgi:hypothetical protein
MADSNKNVALLASASRTVTTPSPTQLNDSRRGCHVTVDITVNTGGLGSITATIEGQDPASGKWYTILASAVLTAVGTVVLRVYPGLVVAANLAANDILPRTWRVNVVANNANPVTYSVGSSAVR